MGRGLSDTDIKNKFLSTVKDVEVEKILGASAEFNDCRKDAKFVAGEDEGKKKAKIEAAKECFQKKLKGKSEEDLKKLSGSLGLESYGLIKSNNINDVTGYLQNKMTKSLTGKDPNEKDPKKILENMKWKNQKIVDQKVFVDLYKNQLMKNALFEVSRYCFEDLRVIGGSGSDFASHWDLSKMEPRTQNGKTVYLATKAGAAKLKDDGDPSFFKLPDGTDTSDKQAVTEAIVNNLSSSGSIDPALYEGYFNYCSTAMPLLCQAYKDGIASSAGKIPPNTGAKSCLVMDRLRNLRKAMDDTAKVAKQFDEMEDKDGKLAIQMLENPSFYERGNGKGEESLDQLTSVSSTDMLANSEKNKDLAQLEKDCRAGNGGSKCEDYLVKSDGLEKSLFTLETEMTLKKEAEVERVKQLKTNEKDLKTYLTENGMFELLNKFESNEISADDLEKEIGKIYDARKVAMIEGLKNKAGSRQMSEAEMKGKDPAKLDSERADNVKQSSEEKARLAQVVLFNNIITSQLSLEDKDGKSLGRNVTAWNKEIKGISKDGGMKEDDKLFKGLQDKAKAEGKTIENASLVDGGIIDTILGKKSASKP